MNEPIENVSDYEEDLDEAKRRRISTREAQRNRGSSDARQITDLPSVSSSPLRGEEILHSSKLARFGRVPKNSTVYENAAATYEAEVKEIVRGGMKIPKKREGSPLIDHTELLADRIKRNYGKFAFNSQKAPLPLPSVATSLPKRHLGSRQQRNIVAISSPDQYPIISDPQILPASPPNFNKT